MKKMEDNRVGIEELTRRMKGKVEGDKVGHLSMILDGGFVRNKTYIIVTESEEISQKVLLYMGERHSTSLFDNLSRNEPLLVDVIDREYLEEYIQEHGDINPDVWITVRAINDKHFQFEVISSTDGTLAEIGDKVFVTITHQES